MIVQNRYEYYASTGKVFTRWFDIKEFDSLEECKYYISSRPKIINKLKNEYRIKDEL